MSLYEFVWARTPVQSGQTLCESLSDWNMQSKRSRRGRHANIVKLCQTFSSYVWNLDCFSHSNAVPLLPWRILQGCEHQSEMVTCYQVQTPWTLDKCTTTAKAEVICWFSYILLPIVQSWAAKEEAEPTEACWKNNENGHTIWSCHSQNESQPIRKYYSALKKKMDPIGSRLIPVWSLSSKTLTYVCHCVSFVPNRVARESPNAWLAQPRPRMACRSTVQKAGTTSTVSVTSTRLVMAAPAHAFQSFQDNWQLAGEEGKIV